MKILHLCTTCNVGGASRSAYRLHRGLQKIGCDSSMLIRQGNCVSSENVRIYSPSKKFPDRIYRRFRRARVQKDFYPYKGDLPSTFESFTDDRSSLGNQLVDEHMASFDIINLHWVGRDFFDYQGFFCKLPNHIPVVWTLHDMNPFTGGCHYDNFCGRYIDQCGSCPTLGSSFEDDLSRKIWARKKHAVDTPANRSRMHIVAPSRWLGQKASESSLFSGLPVSIIPYGLDENAFQPCGKGLKTALGIPESRPMILFVSERLNNYRKGISLLLDTLTILEQGGQDAKIVAIGATNDSLPPKICCLGRISEDWLLCLAYSAADLFVIPSLQDNLPNTVLESLACGTPVVGFEVGGIADMVQPGETGLLAPAGDVQALAVAIRTIINDNDMRLTMSRKCRSKALERYTLDRQADAYARLYHSLLENKRL